MNAMNVSYDSFIPLTEEESTDTGGGFGVLAAIGVGLAIAAGAEIMGDWDNFKNGLCARPEVK